ncbi:cytochrome c3 family protein [candidate division KSB1 bacterium]
MRWDLYTKDLILIITIAIISACSPKSNYKVLSVFFDGVPNPSTADSIARIDSINQTIELSLQSIEKAKSQFVFHPPYLEKYCASCHDQSYMGQFLETMPGLCYQCHENFGDLYKVMHGPVDAGFCSECHNPHMSKNESLLLRTGQELCLYCHSHADVFKNEVHADIENTDCTECHNPHGGDDRFIFN